MGSDRPLTEATEGDWDLLAELLDFTHTFALVVALCHDADAARSVRGRLTELGRRAGWPIRALVFDRQSPAEALTALLGAPGAGEVAWFEALGDAPGRRDWWTEVAARLNERREWLRSGPMRALVLVAPPWARPVLRDTASDLWSINALLVQLHSVEAAPEVRPTRRALAEAQVAAALALPDGPLRLDALLTAAEVAARAKLDEPRLLEAIAEASHAEATAPESRLDLLARAEWLLVGTPHAEALGAMIEALLTRDDIGVALSFALGVSGPDDIWLDRIDRWLDRHGTSESAGAIYVTLLARPGAPDPRVLEYAARWLDHHGSTEDASFVYRAFLQGGTAPPEVLAHAARWVELHRRHPQVDFVCKRLLRSREVSDADWRRAAAVMLGWIARTPMGREHTYALGSLMPRAHLLAPAQLDTWAHHARRLLRKGVPAPIGLIKHIVRLGTRIERGEPIEPPG